MKKPGRIFDRDVEWQHLVRFAERAGTHVQLGVVSGRRRQGKTYLLDALAERSGALYFGATQATSVESLGLFGAALAQHAGSPVPLRFDGWDEAVTYFFSAPQLQNAVVIIDEFPYLVAVAPALPSILQREIDRAASRGGGPSLLLCGSAVSVMGQMLAGDAPLRGRSNLELVVRPFDFRIAARYWGITDPRLGVMTHAVVGGTPAYRGFVNDDVPGGHDDFDAWVARTVLNPGTPLFLEPRYLLAEEVGAMREASIYHSVLAAVAAGNNTRGGIAGHVGRKAPDLTHYLNVWEDTGLLVREEDVFRSGRSHYRIAEPLISFYEVVGRPQWGRLEAGHADVVWADARARFAAQVLGPHFESLCRRWAELVGADVFGGLPGGVGAGVVADARNRTQIEIDVAVLAPAEGHRPRRVLSLGEAKWGTNITPAHVDRLRRAAELLAGAGYDTSATRLTCYSGTGFGAPMRDVARGDSAVQLVDLADLYATGG